MQALADAAPDGIVMPFAENYRYLVGPLLAVDSDRALTARVLAPGEAGAGGRATVRPGSVHRRWTEREYAPVIWMAQRLTNREIAEKRFPEGSAG